MAENTTIKLTESVKKILDSDKESLMKKLNLSSLSSSDVVAYYQGKRGEI